MSVTGKEYNYYLFDADGTLVDTIELIYRSFEHLAKSRLGKKLSREKILTGVGSPLKDQLIIHFGADGDIESLLAEYQQYQLSILNESVSLFPGVEKTLANLFQAGKQLAVVTSRRRASLEIILEQTGIAHYFTTLITPEETRLHKPEPEPALEAIRRLGAIPYETVFIGDAHYDINCGALAGVDTIFVKWSHNHYQDLPVPPTMTIERMEDLMV